MRHALLCFFACLAPSLARAAAPVPQHSKNVITTVKHLTRVKILESNNVTLRPGSVYDNATYFESLLDLPRPGYNYEFLDSGLGAAEPLYPMYQKGFQYSYGQLLKAALSEKNRHIDHFSSLSTPEGCRVDSMYLLRGIDEYPHEYAQEKKDGYAMIVVRLEYYTRLKRDAQCGRHRANDPDPAFDPVKFMKKNHGAMRLSDLPAKDLERFEAKTAAIYHIRQTLKPKWPRFDLTALEHNSLWYYENGHAPDYGLRAARAQPGLGWFKLPRHMVVESTPQTRGAFPLASLLSARDFGKVLDFLNGKPVPGFDPATEPGVDTLRLADVTPKNYYTSGLELENIRDVAADVSDPSHFQLVSMTIKPFEEQEDMAWDATRVIPQIRFVYQLVNPRTGRPAEQLYLHLKWDAVDRLETQAKRDEQHAAFLERVDLLTKARETDPAAFPELLGKFVADYTSARPIETVAFSSSLTGIWVFGSLGRERNAARELEPVRIVRSGVDVGYYSTTYDNDVFRAEAAKAAPARKAELEKVLDDVTVSYFRDPKRMDVHAISFNRVTCAQCHQTSARDGVHMSFNDGLDRRFTAPINATEYFFREADQQLKTGMQYFLRAHR